MIADTQTQGGGAVASTDGFGEIKARWKGDGRQKRNGMTKSEWLVWKRVSGWKGCEIRKTGWPDFLVVDNGHMFCLEVKTGKEPVTKEQRRMHELLASNGIQTYIVRDGWCEQLQMRLSPNNRAH